MFALGNSSLLTFVLLVIVKLKKIKEEHANQCTEIFIMHFLLPTYLEHIVSNFFVLNTSGNCTWSYSKIG